MSLGLPGHLRPQSIGRAFARGSHVVSLICLLASIGIVASVQAAHPEYILWPAILALIPMLVVLWLLDRFRTRFFSAAYVVIGGAAIYWYALTVMSEYPLKGTDSFVLSMPRVALLLVGGSGLGILSAIVWSVIALAVAETVLIVAALQTGIPIRADSLSLVVLGLVVLTLLLMRMAQWQTRHAQPDLHRAARDEQLAAMRYTIEGRAAAVMHDTILGHLAAIGAAPSGPIGRELQAQIERDLEIVVGEEWLADPSSTVDARARNEWQHNPLYGVVQETRQLGLQVELSGDISALARLDSAAAMALALAAKQCLVNVLKHSGTDSAEAVVYGLDAGVTVMIIDTGRGFSEAETGSDRLGLRHSVRKRIEDVGGTVQVWSTIGRGTSVVISVPTDTAAVRP